MNSTGKPYWATMTMTKKSNLPDSVTLIQFAGIDAESLSADLWNFIELVTSFPFLVTKNNLKFEWG
jgi:hypothetical protein